METIGYKAPGRCPVCDGTLLVSRLTCSHCGTKVEGEFTTCRFCRLPDEQREFIEVFIKCRGNIKNVEKELGISYPTVRNRLDGAIRALGYRVERDDREPADRRQQRRDVLAALERGELTPGEAVRRLRGNDPPGRGSELEGDDSRPLTTDGEIYPHEGGSRDERGEAEDPGDDSGGQD